MRGTGATALGETETHSLDAPYRAMLVRAPNAIEGAPRFVRTFRAGREGARLVSAVLDVTAEGVVEPYLNGERVGIDVLSPGWSAYEWRLRVVRHDVTAALVSSAPDTEHELALVVGNGWYCGRLGWMGARRVYGERPGASAQLRLEFSDGSGSTIVTDTTWRVQESSTRSNDLYDGQRIDARISDTDLHDCEVEAVDGRRLVRHRGPLVVRHEVLEPRATWTTPNGSLMVDFGQNIVGWLRLDVHGARGHVITARHAEVLDDGRLAVRPLRSALAEDEFVLSGGCDVFEPTFTFHGFRFAEIDGWDGVTGTITAVVVGSDLRRVGHFACSDPLLDRFHQNVVWSLRGNTVAIPTDCPQRDERLGWTGDIAVFAPTACFLFDMNGFLGDWLADLRAEQLAAGGRVPYVVPDALKGWSVDPSLPPESTGIWSDAAVWVPWAMWEASGDRSVLVDSYASMRAHVDHVAGLLSRRGVWDAGFQFGDWLDPTAPPEDPHAAAASPGVIASAAYHRSVMFTARTAELLGRPAESDALLRRAAELRARFAEAYLHADGTIESDAQAAYALAIVTGVLTPAAEATAGARLAELVRASGYRIAAGFAGAPYLCAALSETGHLDEAYSLLMSTRSPSWLHSVELGATTIWERWDSMLDDGSINPGEMTSFNHYALGAVADWIHRTVGGIVPLAPGYSRVRIDPQPGGGLTWAKTHRETRFGTVAVHWEFDRALKIRYHVPDAVTVEVPAKHARGATRVPLGDIEAD